MLGKGQGRENQSLGQERREGHGVVGWEETAGESLVGVSITENLKAGGGSDAEFQMGTRQVFKTEGLHQRSQSDGGG